MEAPKPNKDLAILPGESPYVREISLVFGKTGMGKSNYIKGYLKSLPRILIIDPLNEYPGRPFTEISSMIDYLEPLAEPDKPFAVKTCNVEHLEPLCQIVNSMENVTLVIEEAQRCLPASTERISPDFRMIIFEGRHFGRSLVISAQRPSIVHIAARSQWTRIVSFNITESSDVSWIANVSGYDITSENDLRKFPVGQYIEITPGDYEVKNAPLYVPPRGKGDVSENRIESFFAMFAVNN